MASERGRADARRRGREWDVARPEAEPSTADLHERIARERALVDLVMALDEPYHRTILLRYFEGLAPPAIAEREGVPVATVKTRLRRALEQLRERLDAQHDGERGVWMLALGAIASREGAAAATGVVLMKKMIVTVACALVLTGGWWLARDSVQGAAVEPDAPRGVVAVDAPLERPHARDGATEVFEAEPTTRSVGAERGGRALRAVERGSGELLEGAEFWFVAYEKIDPRQESEPQVQRLGTHVAMGEAAVLPPSAPYSVVIARSGAHYGYTYVAPGGEGDVIVECAVDRSIGVRVVDESGRPVPGVEVELRSGAGSQARSIWSGTTAAPDGIAELRHFDVSVGKRLDGGTRYVFSLAIPMRAPPEVVLDVERFPTEPVELVLPATGKLEVEVVDADGAPVAIDRTVSAYGLDVDSSGRVERLAGFHRYMRGASRATFPHVELGIELWVWLQDDGAARGVELRLAGPSRPGQAVTARLEVGARYPTFAGKLVDSDGRAVRAPYVASSLTYEHPDYGEREMSPRAQLDEQGRFELPMSNPAVAGSTCRVALITPTTPGGGDVLSGSFEARAPVGDETVDVGTVVLRQSPLIAAGIVVDAAGVPIERADLQVAEKINQREDPEDFNWSFASIGMGYTGADGRFEIRGLLEPGEYALWPRKNGYANRGFVRFTAGTVGLELVLDRPASLAGSLLTRASFPAERLSVALVYPEATREQQAYARWGGDVQSSGSFGIEQLRPGVADFSVRASVHADALLTVAGVNIKPGEECRDPRLQSLDVRDLVRLVELEVVGEDGAPVERGHVRLGDKHYGLDEGRLSLVASMDARELEVYAPGYMPERMNVPDGSRRVELQRGIPVTLRVPEGVVAPEPPLQLLVGLRTRVHAEQFPLFRQDGYPSGRVATRERTELVSVAGPGLIRVHVPEPGEYALTWLALDPGDVHGGGGTRWVDPEHHIVDVAADGVDEALDVPIDLEDYARVRAESR